MKIVPLKASRRDRSGKGSAGRVRRTGFVPGIVYGQGVEPLNIQINAKELGRLIHGAQGEHAIVELTIEGDAKAGGPAMLKEVQHHPVKGDVVHADLFRIDLTKKIKTLVPTKLEGQAKGVVDGGIVEHTTREVEVLVLPTAIPDFLVVKIGELGIGHSVHVNELIVPEGLEVLTNPDRVVASCLAPRSVKEETPAAAGEGAAAEGAAAPAAGAAAPAAAAGGAAKPAAGGDKGAAKPAAKK